MKQSSSGKCKTCSSPDRSRIELALANGVTTTAAARQFGISSHSLWRHWKRHVSPERKASLLVVGASDQKIDLDALKRIESESLLQHLIAERARLTRIAYACEGAGNFQDATRASTAVMRTLELTAKLLGELRAYSSTTNVTNNFLLSPDWMQLRQVIAVALRPYPDAQRAVLTAIRSMELDRGADVSHARAIEYVPGDRSDA